MIYVIRYVLIALYTVIWTAIACAVVLVNRSGAGIRWVGRSWIRWIHGTCGVRVEVDGLERFDAREPHVFMANHQSAFDISAIIAVLPGRWCFVAKRELLWVPFFGLALALANQIIVDRGNRERAVRSLERGAQRIRNGESVILFPEGTRSPTGALAEFKSGGFHLAIAAGVPIVPVTVSGSQRITPKHSLRIHSGRIHVHCGEPIATAGLSIQDRGRLKAQVREAILKGFDPALQG